MRKGRGIREIVIVLSELLSPETKSLNAFPHNAMHCPAHSGMIPGGPCDIVTM